MTTENDTPLIVKNIKQQATAGIKRAAPNSADTSPEKRVKLEPANEEPFVKEEIIEQPLIPIKEEIEQPLISINQEKLSAQEAELNQPTDQSAMGQSSSSAMDIDVPIKIENETQRATDLTTDVTKQEDSTAVNIKQENERASDTKQEGSNEVKVKAEPAAKQAETTEDASTDGAKLDNAKPEEEKKKGNYWKDRKRALKAERAEKAEKASRKEWVPRERTEDEEPKKPKRKVALLMGYCGTGYSGMQINPNVQTIELELLKALEQSGAVSKDNAMDTGKISFMRAARTDKGVHAAGQVCSLNMIIEDENIVEKINQHLPEQIRVWGYVRTTNSFHAKNACDSRIYEYLLPTYVFKRVNPFRYPESAVAVEIKKEIGWLDVGYIDSPKATPEELRYIRAIKADPDQLTLFKEILKQYEGTHNFHNFTVNKTYKDKSCMRYIMELKLSDPVILGGMEWVKVTIYGQSFMLHQIRKMIGLAVMMVRTRTPASLIRLALGKEKLNVPKIPALGLLLERTVYKRYNAKWCDSERDPIDFDKYKEAIEAFKEQWIYSKLVQEEVDTGTFDEWIRVIDNRSIDYAWYLNDAGEIRLQRKPPSLGEFGKEKEKVKQSGSKEGEKIANVKIENGASNSLADTQQVAGNGVDLTAQDAERSDNIVGVQTPGNGTGDASHQETNGAEISAQGAEANGTAVQESEGNGVTVKETAEDWLGDDEETMGDGEE